MKRALVVDNHEDCREFIKAALPCYAWDECARLSCAFTHLEKQAFDLIVLDLALDDSPPEATIASLAGFMALAGNAAVIVITGHPSALEGRLIPADAMLIKPFKVEQLDQAVALATAANNPKNPRSHTSLLLAATKAALKIAGATWTLRNGI
ncbi:MAG: hypothetical protein NTU84_00625 [Verrucomicrobia bacterium]|nr:hypothetical protein [Verrucomicrobiota bacterium]